MHFFLWNKKERIGHYHGFLRLKFLLGSQYLAWVSTPVGYRGRSGIEGGYGATWVSKPKYRRGKRPASWPELMLWTDRPWVSKKKKLKKIHGSKTSWEATASAGSPWPWGHGKGGPSGFKRDAWASGLASGNWEEKNYIFLFKKIK
jgi:hypothetical protein